MAESRSGDRHAKGQLNVRFPPDVLGRLKADAARHGQTVTDIVVRGAVAELDRLDGIATAERVSPARKSREKAAPAPVFLAAENGHPPQDGQSCTHPKGARLKGRCTRCKTFVGFE